MHEVSSRMHADCSRMFQNACRFMSLHEGPWACMQLHKVACSYISLHAVLFFVWAAHKNFAVLVMIITGYQVNVHNRICYNSEKRTSSLLVSTVMKLWHTLWRQGCHNCHLDSNICLDDLLDDKSKPCHYVPHSPCRNRGWFFATSTVWSYLG